MPNKTKPQKPKRTKKVFRMWKFISCTNTKDKQHCQLVAEAFNLGWPQKCEGKTLKELASEDSTSYYLISDNWLVEEEY